MSGFAALVRFDRKPIEPEVLAARAHALRFRAPDGESTGAVDGAGFASARMDIQGEPSGGQQPLCLDDRWWIVAHARLYGRAELISALGRAGVEARSDQPDAWLIVLAFRAWGQECLSRLNGDFTFVIWDARERELFGAIDQMGTRPLFYAEGDHCIEVSNTLSVLRDASAAGRDLDDQFIADFLCLGLSLAPAATAFRNIRRLPPAHFLSVRDGQRPRIQRYWSLPTPDIDLKISAPDAISTFRRLLEIAVLERLPCGPASLTLSGGLDSTSIAAIATRARTSGLKSFTRGSRRHIDDPEPALAAVVATALGLPHELLDNDHDLPFEGWDARMPFMPEPLDEPYWAGKHVARLTTAAHSRVVMSGEGGDELLYPEMACDLIGRVPVMRLMTDMARYYARYGRRPAIGLKRAWRRWRGLPSHLVSHARVPDWLNPDLVHGLKLRERVYDFFNTADGLSTHPTHPAGCQRMNAATLVTRGANDPGTMGLPLEWRTPFLDLRLVEFVYSLPPSYWCTRKAILREAMNGRLPEVILTRPKTGVLKNAFSNHVARTGTPWWDHFRPAPSLERFVPATAIAKLRSDAQSAESHDERVRTNLRPIGLNYWLNSLNQAEVN